MTSRPKPLRAYHGNATLKRDVLAQMARHRTADQLLQGQYWRDGKGCAVACLTHHATGGHHLYPTKWGIPEMLAHLEDRIFEGLTNGKAQAWPERFLGAIPVGADLSKVGPKFLLALITRRRKTLDAEGVRLVEAAMDEVLAFLRRWARTGVLTPELIEMARSAAAAAEAAAWSAAEAAAAAARSAEAAAEAAAWSARSAEAAAEAEYEWMADTLIRLLRRAA